MINNLPITVIGLEGGWNRRVSQEQLAVIGQADLLVGGKRQLGLFDGGLSDAKRIAITANIAEVMGVVGERREAGDRVVVLATGDPLCFGIGGTLRRFFEAEDLHVVPAVSSFQLAFGALGEPWQAAKLVTAHGRDQRKALVAVMTNRLTAILTDGRNTPRSLATDLLGMGFDGGNGCAVCERLGSDEQAIHQMSVAEAAEREFDALNVFVVWNNDPKKGGVVGLNDNAFVTERKQITKREVRLSVLGEMGLRPGEVLWDIGAGSGSVGIEAALSQPSAQVFAVEQDGVMVGHIEQNKKVHGAFNLAVEQGKAPDGLAEWPDPDVVFVGGSGGNLGEILAVAKDRLAVGGRLVATFATLENLLTFQDLVPDASVYQVQVNRMKGIGKMNRLESLNPVFVCRWIKGRR